MKYLIFTLVLFMSSCVSYMETGMIVDSVKPIKTDSYKYKVKLKQYNVAGSLSDERVKIVDSPEYKTILTNNEYIVGDTLILTSK